MRPRTMRIAGTSLIVLGAIAVVAVVTLVLVNAGNSTASPATTTTTAHTVQPATTAPIPPAGGSGAVATVGSLLPPPARAGEPVVTAAVLAMTRTTVVVQISASAPVTFEVRYGSSPGRLTRTYHVPGKPTRYVVTRVPVGGSRGPLTLVVFGRTASGRTAASPKLHT